MGIGLGYELNDVGFSVIYSDIYKNGLGLPSGTAIASVRRKIRNDWRFEFFSFDVQHIVSIAFGPTLDVLETFRTDAWSVAQTRSGFKTICMDALSSQNEPELTPKSPEYIQKLHSPLPPLEKKSVGDLLPEALVPLWDELIQQHNILKIEKKAASEFADSCDNTCFSLPGCQA